MTTINRDMRCDMHVHTEFSGDSEAKMQDYLEVAKEKQITCICFTDHVDYNKLDYGYGYYNPECYFEALNKVKIMAGDSIRILSGIEFSEPHLYQKELVELKRFPYNFIIGSVHWIGDLFPCREVREKIPAKEFYRLYWNEVLATVKAGGFDCLGHIDFPKRYYHELVYEETVMTEIFSIMVQKGIVPEINTSSLRKGISTTMPDEDLLKIYYKCGGRSVTIGSDAHVTEDLAADFEYAESIIKNLGLICKANTN